MCVHACMCLCMFAGTCACVQVDTRWQYQWALSVIDLLHFFKHGLLLSLELAYSEILVGQQVPGTPLSLPSSVHTLTCPASEWVLEIQTPRLGRESSSSYR